LRRANLPFQALHLHPGSHAGYYPGAEFIAMKVLFAPDTGRLLGAQAVGRDGVDKRIDVLATALKRGMTMDDLAELELAYAPPFGSAKDPVNLAGMAAQNVLAGDVQLAQWNEIGREDSPLTSPSEGSAAVSAAARGQQEGLTNFRATVPSEAAAGGPPAPPFTGRDSFVLLDVRDSDERAEGFIPGSIHIPLDQIRARMNELPRDREIVVYCLSGQRSYFACRILAQHGFRARNLTGSYRTWNIATTRSGP
jgi:rhodanese-related sulfurtransferase